MNKSFIFDPKTDKLKFICPYRTDVNNYIYSLRFLIRRDQYNHKVDIKDLLNLELVSHLDNFLELYMNARKIKDLSIDENNPSAVLMINSVTNLFNKFEKELPYDIQLILEVSE